VKPAPEDLPGLTSRVRGFAVGFCLGRVLQLPGPSDEEVRPRRDPATGRAGVAAQRGIRQQMCWSLGHPAETSAGLSKTWQPDWT